MNEFKWKYIGLVIVLTAVIASVAIYGALVDTDDEILKKTNGIIPLVPPSFIGMASASDPIEEQETAFPELDAGISAYINTTQDIDINEIKSIFTLVEEVGDNYIYGIVPIDDWGGPIDVHVYADTTGWIVAYLQRTEPAAKIMQWTISTSTQTPDIAVISTTILKDAIFAAGDASSVWIDENEIYYYDFKFPNADGMMLFIRTRADEGANIHQLQIPTNYTLHESSYFHYIYYYNYYSNIWDSLLKVDDKVINNADTSTAGGSGSYTWYRHFGFYGSNIEVGSLHTIEISYTRIGNDSRDNGSAGVATALIYRTG